MKHQPQATLHPETTYAAIVGRVLAMRRQRGQLQQAEVARTVGVTQATWSRIENGESALTVDQLALASKALQISAAEILQMAERAQEGLVGQGVIVRYGSTREFAKNGLAIIGAVALGMLVLAAVGKMSKKIA